MHLHRSIPAPTSAVHSSPRTGVRGRLQPETRQGYILLCMALWSVISFLLISNFIVSTVTIIGTSMVPSLHPGQVYLLNRWSHRIRPPVHGDLVVIRDRHHNELLVKRVIALPRDTIQFQRGQVLLNGSPLEEPYLLPGTLTPSRHMGHEPRELAGDEYFVMGDNRLSSEDSRRYGPIRRADILGTISQ
jgi:signal peptidase I